MDEDDVQKLSLFQEESSKKILKEDLRIENIDFEKLEFKPNYKHEELSDYTSKTRSGFLNSK